MLEAKEEGREDVAHVSFHHGLHVGDAVFVAGEFVVHLSAVDCGAAYLLFAFHAQAVAHLGHDGGDDGVEHMVSVHEEIGGVGCDPELLELDVEVANGSLVPWIMLLKVFHLSFHLLPEVVEACHGRMDAEIAQFHDMVEVGEREVLVEV